MFMQTSLYAIEDVINNNLIAKSNSNLQFYFSINTSQIGIKKVSIDQKSLRSDREVTHNIEKSVHIVMFLIYQWTYMKIEYRPSWSEYFTLIR